MTKPIAQFSNNLYSLVKEDQEGQNQPLFICLLPILDKNDEVCGLHFVVSEQLCDALRFLLKKQNNEEEVKLTLVVDFR